MDQTAAEGTDTVRPGGVGGEQPERAADGAPEETLADAPSHGADQSAAGLNGHPDAATAAVGGVPPQDGPPDGEDEQPPAEPAKAKAKKKQRPFIVELPFLIAIALVLAFLIKTFLIQAFVIPSSSMENTLNIGDRVLVNRISTWFGSKPARGQIIVFQDPGGWLESKPSQSTNPVTRVLTFIGLMPEDNGDLIKRVIGVPGDHVKCCDPAGRITVNGVPLNETSYLNKDSVPSTTPFDITVPPGQLWVMGDHRSVSADSRAHMGQPGGGTIPESKVVGQAFAIGWPPSRIRTLPVPGTFDQKALAVASAPGGAPAIGLVGALPLTLLRRRRKLRRAAG